MQATQPIPRNGQAAVYLPPEAWEYIRGRAEREGRSVSSVIRRCVQRAMSDSNRRETSNV